MYFKQFSVLRSRCLRMVYVILLLTSFVAFPLVSSAQTSADASARLSMTLTPPLYQLTLSPGASWSSALRFINGNPYELTVYAIVNNFSADGETGTASFSTPSGSGPNAHELSSWITVSQDPIRVRRGASIDIPFTITIPKNAEPGGHYAAMLVGTQSDRSVDPETKGSGMAVASEISSLFFIRITGDIVEKGTIRDFYPNDSLVDSQDATFSLRFENDGNVHVVPQGDIVIRNMFGKERGRISINEKNTFGNVLPHTTRKFQFEWQGEKNFFDIGRYEAIATLVYGEDGRKSVYKTTYFWVIPWIPILLIVTFLILFVWGFQWGLRRYVANAIQMERALYKEMSESDHRSHPSTTLHQKSPRTTFTVLSRPLVDGAVQFGNVGHKYSDSHSKKQKSSYHEFFKQYRLFFLFVGAFVLCMVMIILYFVQVFESERGYQMVIKKDGVHDIILKQ